MGGHVAVRQVAVFGFQQHVAVRADENGAEGMIATLLGARGDRESAPQEVVVCWFHEARLPIQWG